MLLYFGSEIKRTDTGITAPCYPSSSFGWVRKSWNWIYFKKDSHSYLPPTARAWLPPGKTLPFSLFLFLFVNPWCPGIPSDSFFQTLICTQLCNILLCIYQLPLCNFSRINNSVLRNIFHLLLNGPLTFLLSQKPDSPQKPQNSPHPSQWLFSLLVCYFNWAWGWHRW